MIVVLILDNECEGGLPMVECLNCGHEYKLDEEEISEDKLGKYVLCEKCGSSFDI